MTMQLDAVRAFHAIPMFSSLTSDEAMEILQICRAMRKPAGSVLFRQGERGDSAFIVESGVVDIVLEENARKDVVARLGPGDVVGELALIDPGPRSASAVITEDAVVYELPGEAFRALRDQLRPAAFKVVRHLSRVVCLRLRSVNTRIEALLAGRELPPVEVSTTRPGRTAASPTVVTEAPEPEPADDAPGVLRRVLSRFWSGGNP